MGKKLTSSRVQFGYVLQYSDKPVTYLEQTDGSWLSNRTTSEITLATVYSSYEAAIAASVEYSGKRTGSVKRVKVSTYTVVKVLGEQ